MELQGRVALVTGSARRLGREIALALADAGCHVALHYRHSAAEARSLRRQCREKDVAAEIFQADLALTPQIDGLLEQVQNRFERLDILINNASFFQHTPLQEISESTWNLILDVNLKAPFLLCQKAAHMMQQGPGGGRIVNISDVGGLRPWAGYIPYCVAKAGLIAMTQGLALALAPTILVNAIAPGIILPPDGATPQDAAEMARRNPLRRLGDPRDVVNAILYLLRGSDFVTGQVMVIDGGRLLK